MKGTTYGPVADVARAKVRLFELLRGHMPNITDREARLLMHLVRDEAVRNPTSASSRKK